MDFSQIDNLISINRYTATDLSVTFKAFKILKNRNYYPQRAFIAESKFVSAVGGATMWHVVVREDVAAWLLALCSTDILETSDYSFDISEEIYTLLKLKWTE